MINFYSEQIAKMVAMAMRPLPRIKKKHRTRTHQAARRALVRLAGHRSRSPIGEREWEQILTVIHGWPLTEYVSVPRTLQKRLGKAIGGPWWRAKALRSGYWDAPQIALAMMERGRRRLNEKESAP